MDNIASYLEIIPQNEFGGPLFAQALKSYQPFCAWKHIVQVSI